jgi:protein-disulfide isomerase
MNPRPASPSAGALLAALAASLVGLALSLYLARLHAQAHAGIASFCAISDVVNCDRVATSRYSVALGLPVAVWGAFGYGLAGLLAGLALARRRLAWPLGLLFLVAAAAVVASVVLALVSKLAIGAWCILCAASWIMSAVLLASARRACRPPGVVPALRASARVVRERPLVAAALVAAGLATVAGAAKAYPRYWERSGRPAQASGGPVVPRDAAGRLVVVKYSDYECPFCAREHEESRTLLASRPDVVVIHRQFPLDDACNPAVKRKVHPSACALARAGICAAEQGRAEQMDDALFGNQRAELPVAELAARVGLDVARFRACLASQDTDRRLAADIAAGIRQGVRATPTYVVGDLVRAGPLPVEFLPAPSPPAAGAATGSR